MSKRNKGLLSSIVSVTALAVSLRRAADNRLIQIVKQKVSKANRRQSDGNDSCLEDAAVKNNWCLYLLSTSSITRNAWNFDVEIVTIYRATIAGYPEFCYTTSNSSCWQGQSMSMPVIYVLYLRMQWMALCC
mmetsp:Transcript_27012/g.59556  ORF Transcript_27012/g.59556 Transcript_27012/m.59556 type:complete len:132 (+) Transcript_27012:70-465(+)